MAELQFNVSINASRQKVWEQLWSEEGYRAWTAIFTEGSYAESDWQQGSKIKFLSPNGSGMYGIIQTKIDNERMTFEHHGEVKEGMEMPKDWAGATEDYQLLEHEGATNLTVILNMNADFHDYFNNTFPNALQVVKQLSEKQE